MVATVAQAFAPAESLWDVHCRAGVFYNQDADGCLQGFQQCPAHAHKPASRAAAN